MKFIANIVLVFLICNSINIYAQRSKTEDNLTDREKEILAEEALQEEKYDRAVLLYKKLLNKDPDNSKINFLVGFCYLNTDYGKEQAIEFFEKAISYINGNNPNNAPLEAYYYLALAYYHNYNFNKAIEVLNEVSGKISKHENLFNFRIKRLKAKCENANNISKIELKIKVENLFDVNSKYSDHSPLINHDETELIFTSRREGTKIRVKSADGQFDENIYFSKKNEDSWEVPYSLSNAVNSSSHETATYISIDGQTMIIHKYDHRKGSLYISEKNKAGEWSPAVALGSNINTKYRETAGCLSPDGQQFYFISDRKGGYGGLDIYVSQKMADGTWGPAKNLGATINTGFNEETPFIHNNGTLFFCSEGHNSIGGFDIFASSGNDKNKWSNPVNMGIPINSVQDDFFYIPSPNGRFAYFASKRQGGKGNSDIYRIELNNTQGKNYAVISGNIRFSDKNPMQGALKFYISDKNGKRIKSYTPDLKKNYFNFMLETGNSYILSINYQNFTTHKIKLNIGKKGSFYSLEQHVFIDDIFIKSLSDSDYYQMPTQGNIKIVEYKSKPKSKNISDEDLLANNDNKNISTNSYSENTDVEENKIFSIQLLNSRTSFNDSYFGDLQDVKSHIEKDGSYIYYLGEYIYEWEAMIKLRMIREKYPKAYIFVNKFSEKKIN